MTLSRPVPARRGPIRRERLGGIGDEAGSALETQVRAISELGFGSIELRSVDGVNVGDLDEQHWGRVSRIVERAGIRVSVLASRIGSWARPVDTPFESELRELDALLVAAEHLDRPFVRIMSYPNDGWGEREWRAEVIRRTRILAAHAADSGVTLLHENCHGWAADRPDRALELLNATGERGLALLFDVGNPVVHGYDGLEYLRAIAPHVAHCHVKDAHVTSDGDVTFAMPGEGSTPLVEAVETLLRAGYAGAFSIEPHIDLVPHDPSDGRAGNAGSYVRWGRQLAEILDQQFGLT